MTSIIHDIMLAVKRPNLMKWCTSLLWNEDQNEIIWNVNRLAASMNSLKTPELMIKNKN